MVRSSLVFSLLAVLALLLTPVSGSATEFALVIAEDGSQAETDYGLDAVDQYATGAGTMLVVELNPGQSANSLRQAAAGDPNIIAVDDVFLSSLGPTIDSGSGLLDELPGAGDASGLVSSPCLDRYFEDGSWGGWAEQTASTLTHIREAQMDAGHCGEGVTVALIDTGVDAQHPLLAGSVVSGYDFLANSNSSSAEWSGLGGTSITIVESSLRATASGSYTAIVESSPQQIAFESNGTVSGSYTCIIESGTFVVLLSEDQADEFQALDLPPRFGHGTMVAGLIRLVAPGAEIMPLRAFDAFGFGASSDIVRAIYYAVDHGADVINMSFSMERHSPAVSAALRYARDHGVVVAAAAGNRSSNDLTYPASDSRVIGVASSNLSDVLADFSNFGPNNADLVAPGVALISSYPGGHFAAGWGTSFSTPLVAGAAALLRFGQPDDATTHRDTVEKLLTGVEFVGLQGQVLTGGRLDVEGAVLQSLD